jgi:hypothetical protein
VKVYCVLWHDGQTGRVDAFSSRRAAERFVREVAEDSEAEGWTADIETMDIPITAKGVLLAVKRGAMMVAK